MMEDSSSDDEFVPADGNPVVIGRWTSTGYTNWRYRYDALSQIDAAYLSDLQLFQESNNNNIQISILILYSICIKIHCIPNYNINNIQNQELEKLKLILILSFLLIVIQIMNANVIEEEIDDLLNVYEGDRRLEDFLPLQNRSFDVLTEENSRFWTRFNKDQLVTLYEHLRIPNIV
jgi:hypothetical protein